MRSGRLLLAAVFLAALLHATTASALAWEEWKELIRERPIAVLIASPAFVVTAPFYGGTWLVGKAIGSEGGEEDDDEADADEDDESDEDDEDYDDEEPDDEGDEGDEEEEE